MKYNSIDTVPNGNMPVRPREGEKEREKEREKEKERGRERNNEKDEENVRTEDTQLSTRHNNNLWVN